MAKKDGNGGEQEDCGHKALRPNAIDTPLFHDKRFEIGEEAGAHEAKLRQVQDDPEAVEERKQRDEDVACYAEVGDGNVMFRSGGLVEGTRWEVSEAAMVHSAAIPVLGDGAGRGGVGVHVVDAQGEDGDGKAGEREQGDEKPHICSF